MVLQCLSEIAALELVSSVQMGEESAKEMAVLVDLLDILLVELGEYFHDGDKTGDNLSNSEDSYYKPAQNNDSLDDKGQCDELLNTLIDKVKPVRNILLNNTRKSMESWSDIELKETCIPLIETKCIQRVVQHSL